MSTTPKPATSTGVQTYSGDLSGGLGTPKDDEAVRSKVFGSSLDRRDSDSAAPKAVSTGPMARPSKAPTDALRPPARPASLAGIAGGLAAPVMQVASQIGDAFAGLAAPQPSQEVSFLRQTEDQYGLPRDFMATMWQIESSSGRNMGDGRYIGHFQLGPQFDVDRMDFNQSAQAAAEFARSNGAMLSEALGRAPSAEELYLAHQQGPSGARALLTADPNTPVVEVLRRFHGNRAAQVVSGNGGDPNGTVGEFVSRWRRTYRRKREEAMAAQGWSDAPVVAEAPAQPLQYAGLGRSSYNPATGRIEHTG